MPPKKNCVYFFRRTEIVSADPVRLSSVLLNPKDQMVILLLVYFCPEFFFLLFSGSRVREPERLQIFDFRAFLIVQISDSG